MKTSDIGLSFDSKLSRSPWAQISFVSGEPEELWFGTSPTSLGDMTVIGYDDSLCYLGFDEARSIDRCRMFFKKADFIVDQKRADKMIKTIMKIWNGNSDTTLSVMVNGTEFQHQVWIALMNIPTGHAVSYGTIAEAIGRPKAVRAVGTAVGANPISLLIPCHRVVQQTGKVENYGWGTPKKIELLSKEVKMD